MNLKNVKVGETYIIKSLENTFVGNAPFKIGDEVVVRGFRPTHTNTVSLQDAWSVHHKDLKRFDIAYTNPLQEYLGK